MKNYDLEYLLKNETTITKVTCMTILGATLFVCCMSTKLVDITEKSMVKVLTRRYEKRNELEESL